MNIVDGVEDELSAAGTLFDSGIPDSPECTTFNKELHCLISPMWLSDAPINNLGTYIAHPNTVRPSEFQKMDYILSFYSNSSLALQKDPETVNSQRWKTSQNSFNSGLFLTAYNDSGIHWFAAVYSWRLSTWLILDSIHRKDIYYRVAVDHCHAALLQHTGVYTNNQTGHFVVCADWPQQKNSYDCGVYTCIALMFITKHSEKDGIIEKMMSGNQFNFAQPPENLCRKFQRDIFMFSKVTLEPYIPHFRFEIVRPT